MLYRRTADIMSAFSYEYDLAKSDGIGFEWLVQPLEFLFDASTIMMHLSRPHGIGDSHNLDDLERLTQQYPGAKWILAHCARSYSSWPIERASDRLRDMPNTWFDTSSVSANGTLVFPP